MEKASLKFKIVFMGLKSILATNVSSLKYHLNLLHVTNQNNTASIASDIVTPTDSGKVQINFS